MRRFVFLAAAAFLLAFAPAALADTVLVGDAKVEPTWNGIQSGYARAFSYQAVASGTATTMSVWVSPSNQATKIELGLYADNAGRPGQLLDSGSTSNVVANAWNRVTLTGASVTQGRKYWLAVIGNGFVGDADRWTSACTTVRSSSSTLTSLPSTFTSASGSDTRCASLNVSGGGAPPPPPNPVPPSNTKLPSISGTPQQGNMLTAHPGIWTGDTPMTFTYRWSDGTVGKTDTLSASYVGRKMTVTVTARNDANTPVSVTSLPVGPVQPAPPPSGTLVSAGWWPAWQHVPFSSVPWGALTQLIVFSDTTSTTAPFLNTSIHSMTPAMQQQFVPLVHQHGDTAILSIGGSDDQGWSTACNQTNRRTFIDSAIGQMNKYGYDGVELDIEQGPWIGSADFNACVQAFHNTLKATATNAGKAPILSLDEDPSWESQYIPAIAQYLDQINLMGYHDTCANNCAQVAKAISTLTSRGVPASKLIDGIGLDPGMPDATNPSDCGAKAQYLSSSTNLKGLAEWSVQDDYLNHNGTYPCLNALAPYIR